jgi:uncharacterized protein YqhQ
MGMTGRVTTTILFLAGSLGGVRYSTALMQLDLTVDAEGAVGGVPVILGIMLVSMTMMLTLMTAMMKTMKLKKTGRMRYWHGVRMMTLMKIPLIVLYQNLSLIESVPY